MPEALQQVREDLGEEAVILNSRQLRKNNRFNPDDEGRVEVTAAYDAPESERPAPTSVAARKYAGAAAPKPAPKPMPKPESGSGDIEQMLGQFRQLGRAIEDRQAAPKPAGAPEADALAQPAPSDAGEQIMGQLRRLGEAVARLERRAPASLDLPEGLARLVDRLGGIGVNGEVLGRLSAAVLREAGDGDLASRQGAGQALLQAARRLLPSRSDIRLGKGCRVVGFVGAAGVGKSTAVAKIAAGFAARKRRAGRVVWVYAGAPPAALPPGVEAVEAAGADALREVLQGLDDARLVLVDTPGCGAHDGRAWQERRRLLEAAHEVQVVLDGMASSEHMMDLVEASDGLPKRRLLFTKMDQTVRPGAALSAAALSGLPLSYFTAGAGVDGGIEPGEPVRLLAEALGIDEGGR